jgi:hypothetical protein
MMKSRVCALGQDLYWLEAVRKTGDELLTVEAIPCPGNLVECLDRLPAKDANTLLLVDATWQPGVEQLVQRLRQLGWPYVVVVAADPSVKEAHAVLQGNLGYDYWKKTYAASVIRADVARCLEEIERLQRSVALRRVTARQGTKRIEKGTKP